MATSFPLRVHAVHVVRAPWPFDLVWRVFRPFVSSAMRERLYLHGSDLGSLHQHISPDCLPKRYGGQLPDPSYRRWLLAMREDRRVHEEMKSLGYVIQQQQIDRFVSDNAHLLSSTPQPAVV